MLVCFMQLSAQNLWIACETARKCRKRVIPLGEFRVLAIWQDFDLDQAQHRPRIAKEAHSWFGEKPAQLNSPATPNAFAFANAASV
ncbi:MAG: hypothetical protein COB39_07005 [Marinosulfonomonas sp.]|nr:MAG: hypothetical protein COB39_07005 [Marinosulfonomonas sp.]